MKINRLLEITIILLNKGTITAKELASRFEVSTRTIYRDIDVLSSTGVPIYTNKGTGGGISILEDYSINKTLISEKESESLQLALKTLQATRYPEIDSILEKIGAVFKNSAAADWIHIDFSPWGCSPNEYNKFNNIKEAIIKRRVISFDYINADGGKSSRSIEPMRLIFKGQSWYLWGYCLSRNDFRLFRVSRMKNVLVTDKEYKFRDSDNVQKGESPETPLSFVNLKLKFQPEVLHRIYDNFDDGFISKDSDGTYIVEVVFPEDEWIYGYIMSFGHYVEVIEPEYIRKTIAARMKKAASIYEN